MPDKFNLFKKMRFVQFYILIFISVSSVHSSQILMHRYSFNGDLTDSVGGPLWLALLGGTASIVGNAVSIGGAGYVQLPAAITGATISQVTIELWGSFGSSNGKYCRLFQFGSNPSENWNSFEVGGSSGNYLWWEVYSSSSAISQVSNTLLNGLSNAYIVFVYDPTGATVQLFINGALATSYTGSVYAVYNTAYNYIGRSLIWSDAGLTGSIDEFRVWSGLLSPTTISSHYVLGPNNLPSVSSLPSVIPSTTSITPSISHSTSPTAPTIFPSSPPTAPSLLPTSAPTLPSCFAHCVNDNDRSPDCYKSCSRSVAFIAFFFIVLIFGTILFCCILIYIGASAYAYIRRSSPKANDIELQSAPSASIRHGAQSKRQNVQAEPPSQPLSTVINIWDRIEQRLVLQSVRGVCPMIPDGPEQLYFVSSDCRHAFGRDFLNGYLTTAMNSGPFPVRCSECKVSPTKAPNRGLVTRGVIKGLCMAGVITTADGQRLLLQQIRSIEDESSVDREYHMSKGCPFCGTRIAHYKGHGCHHIRPGGRGLAGGCPSCHKHFCYACLEPYVEGVGCKYTSEIHRYCNANCDCPVCPECRPGAPCDACDGPGAGNWCPVCNPNTRS